MRDFRKLEVWKKAYSLSLATYRATKAFPEEERYGLTAQMRRAAVSVPANIAEGCGRETRADFVRILHIASGSCSELDCLLLLAGDLGFLTTTQSQALCTKACEVRKMLWSLSRCLKADC